MENEKDRDVEQVRDIAARISEQFGDYLLIVRTPDGFCWKHSDPTWGVGAAERYTGMIKDQSLLDKIAALEEGE